MSYYSDLDITRKESGDYNRHYDWTKESFGEQPRIKPSPKSTRSAYAIVTTLTFGFETRYAVTYEFELDDFLKSIANDSDYELVKIEYPGKDTQ